MNGSPVAAIVRGWVDLYTRGMPEPVRATRRDEVDDDLWCQLGEAAALGRSPRSLGAEMLLRLLFGMPADVSWRLSHAGTAAADVERNSSMSSRVIGALAVAGGASWGIAAFLVLIYGRSVVTGTNAAVGVLGFGGGLAFAAATIGLVWRFQDRVSPGGAVGGVVAGFGVLLGSLGGYAAFPVFPVGSAVLAWDLARAGILSRALGIIHVVSAAGFLVTLVATVIDYQAMAIAPFVVLAIPYLLSWVAIGASLLRGAPQAHEPAPGA
jgi:hypothetical protein